MLPRGESPKPVSSSVRSISSEAGSDQMQSEHTCIQIASERQRVIDGWMEVVNGD